MLDGKMVEHWLFLGDDQHEILSALHGDNFRCALLSCTVLVTLVVMKAQRGETQTCGSGTTSHSSEFRISKLHGHKKTPLTRRLDVIFSDQVGYSTEKDPFNAPPPLPPSTTPTTPTPLLICRRVKMKRGNREYRGTGWFLGEN